MTLNEWNFINQLDPEGKHRQEENQKNYGRNTWNCAYQDIIIKTQIEEIERVEKIPYNQRSAFDWHCLNAAKKKKREAEKFLEEHPDVWSIAFQ